jgi:hypothetical protein
LLDLGRITDVAPDQGDLPHFAERLELEVKVWVPCDHADTKAIAGEAPDDLCSNEAGTAKNSDKLA